MAYPLCNRIAGNFRGVLILVNFVVHPGVTKFSTHEHFPLCVIYSAVYTWSNLDRRRFVMALFRYLQCPWSTESPFSSCPECDSRGIEQSSVEDRSTTKRKRPQYLSFNAEEHKVTSKANGSPRLPFSRWHSSCSSVY